MDTLSSIKSKDHGLDQKSPKLNYDCICIGTSIIASLESYYQARKGKSVLMVDKEHIFGGAWKSIEIDGIENIENAIHYFLPDKEGIKFMKNSLGLSIVPSAGKFRYFKIYSLGYLKLPFSSKIGRLIDKIFYSSVNKGLISKAKLFFESIISSFREEIGQSYYLSMGSSEMLEKTKSLLNGENVNIWLNSHISEINFDTENRIIYCNINEQAVTTQNLIFGHGARLPEIKSDKGNIKINEKFYPRPAYHLVLKDDKVSESLEIIMTADPLIKYVHDVTRYSSLGINKKENKKVFVFGLHDSVVNHEMLCYELFNKLKDLKVINSNAILLNSLYSETFLPTLNDNDLHKLKRTFGDMVITLRTENISKAMGRYSNRWTDELITKKKI